jgi:hypothetical protein
MKRVTVKLVRILMCLPTLVGASSVARGQSEARRSPVVVELFTSEGCSTCPPADALLARLEREQPIANAEVIALEEHVDYWNQQGWIDPFSSPEWTERQRVYVGRFKQDAEYTPQMVVDGRTQFVGSKLQEAVRAVTAAAEQVKTNVEVHQAKSEGKQDLRLNIKVGKLEGQTSGDTAEIWLAVSERELSSAVKGGENTGRELHHAAVLRLLRKVGTADAREATSFERIAEIKWKSEWIRKNVIVVAMVQEKKSRQILGTAVLRFAN